MVEPYWLMYMSDFSKYKIMELPRNVVVGHDVLSGIPENCARLGLPRSVLIVADEITKKIAGLEIETLLKVAGFNVEMVCIKEADADTVTAVQNQAEEMKNVFLAGIGGGRPIDVAKCASFNAGEDFISVPTAATHDGIVSSKASILVDGIKESLDAQTPLAGFDDTGIIAK